MPTIDLSPIQQTVWETAEQQGHHVHLDPLSPRLQALVRLALVHTEVLELSEAPDRTARLDELADIAIRVLELCWCHGVALTITPCARLRTLDPYAICANLHHGIARLTQLIKRHGITPGIMPLACDVLGQCWSLARASGADLMQAITTKDATNRQRPYQYGTPGAKEPTSCR